MYEHVDFHEHVKEFFNGLTYLICAVVFTIMLAELSVVNGQTHGQTSVDFCGHKF